VLRFRNVNATVVCRTATNSNFDHRAFMDTRSVLPSNAARITAFFSRTNMEMLSLNNIFLMTGDHAALEYTPQPQQVHQSNKAITCGLVSVCFASLRLPSCSSRWKARVRSHRNAN
jgi:hypothetical protein